MTDRRSFLTAAGLTAIAAGSGLGAAGCTAPNQVGSRAATEITVAKSDVPVGGGKILGDAKYVVTQPTAGVYKAFNKSCTHQGCPVSSIAGSEIICKCHGARFSLADGSVVNGPATKALAPANVTVEGDSLKITG